MNLSDTFAFHFTIFNSNTVNGCSLNDNVRLQDANEGNNYQHVYVCIHF